MTEQRTHLSHSHLVLICFYFHLSQLYYLCPKHEFHKTVIKIYLFWPFIYCNLSCFWPVTQARNKSLIIACQLTQRPHSHHLRGTCSITSFLFTPKAKSSTLCFLYSFVCLPGISEQYCVVNNLVFF